MTSKSSAKCGSPSKAIKYGFWVVLVGIALAIYFGGFLSNAPEPGTLFTPKPAPVSPIPHNNIPARREQELVSPAPPSEPQVDDRNVHYEQLLCKRLEFQEKIFEAMDLYRTTSEKVHSQREQLKQYFRDRPVPETIELFSKGTFSEIPVDLRIAYSCWRTLLPDETQRLQIATWIERRQASGILEQLDIQIREIENRRQLGRILDQNELAEIDLLLAQQVVGWEVVDVRDKALLEEEVIENLKAELVNQK